MSDPKTKHWNDEDKENITIYSSLLKEHGNSHKSLDWGSQKSQFLRFKILSEIGLTDNDVILDVGCGLGDFYAWLQDHGYKTRYDGIDIVPAAISHAQNQHDGATFKVQNIMDEPIQKKKYDYVFASGIFAKRPKGGEDYAKSMIKTMFHAAKKGFAFNMLTLLSPHLDADDVAFDPALTLQYCQTLTPFVTLRHDYHPNDMTFYLYKDQTS